MKLAKNATHGSNVFGRAFNIIDQTHTNGMQILLSNSRKRTHHMRAAGLISERQLAAGSAPRRQRQVFRLLFIIGGNRDYDAVGLHIKIGALIAFLDGERRVWRQLAHRTRKW